VTNSKNSLEIYAELGIFWDLFLFTVPTPEYIVNNSELDSTKKGACTSSKCSSRINPYTTVNGRKRGGLEAAV
jgi:hypothetical protein